MSLPSVACEPLEVLVELRLDRWSSSSSSESVSLPSVAFEPLVDERFEDCVEVLDELRLDDEVRLWSSSSSSVSVS